MQEQLEPAAVKYQLLKERGENIEMVFMKIKDKCDAPQIFIRSHIQSDGIDAVIDLMKKDGLEKPKIPVLKSETKPIWPKRLLLMKEHMKRQRPVDYSWKKINRDLKGYPLGHSYISFSSEQTSAIKEKCRQKKCNLNSLILWATDKVASERFLEKKQKRVWMVPINIRENETDRGNNVTALSVMIHENDQPQDIYKQVKGMLVKGIHWGGRIVANLPKYIGISTLRFLTKNAKSPYFGIVSNLGEWNGIHGEKYLVIAPATTFCPITMGVLTWNGSLGLCCQLHPSLSQDINDTIQLLEDCKREILEYVGEENSLTVKNLPWSYVESKAIRF